MTLPTPDQVRAAGENAPWRATLSMEGRVFWALLYLRAHETTIFARPTPSTFTVFVWEGDAVVSRRAGFEGAEILACEPAV